MFSLARPALFTIYVAVLLTFFGSPLSSLHATAAPLPRPALPLSSPVSRTPGPRPDLEPRVAASPLHAGRFILEGTTIGDILASIITPFKATQTQSSRLGNLSTQNGDNEHECSLILDTLLPPLRLLRISLEPFAAGKGLAFYNRNSAFQTLLKNIINGLKQLLDNLILPFEAYPELYDILWEIKCIIVETLDLAENMIDSTSDTLQI